MNRCLCPNIFNGTNGTVGGKLEVNKIILNNAERMSSLPFVNIKITRGASTEQKAQLIAGATKLLQDILDKNPQTTVVVIEEIETDNWGIGGESVTMRRQQGK